MLTVVILLQSSRISLPRQPYLPFLPFSFLVSWSLLPSTNAAYRKCARRTIFHLLDFSFVAGFSFLFRMNEWAVPNAPTSIHIFPHTRHTRTQQGAYRVPNITYNVIGRMRVRIWPCVNRVHALGWALRVLLMVRYHDWFGRISLNCCV